jgi:hypothetical protein
MSYFRAACICRTSEQPAYVAFPIFVRNVQIGLPPQHRVPTTSRFDVPFYVKLRAEAVDPVLQIRALRNGIVALTAQPTGTVLFAINACPLLRYG